MKPAFDLLACPPPGSPRMTGGGRRAAGRGGSGPPATSLACRCSRRPRSGPPGAALRRGDPPSATGSWSAVLWPPPALCGIQGSSSPKRLRAREEEAVSWGSSSPCSSTFSPLRPHPTPLPPRLPPPPLPLPQRWVGPPPKET